MPSSACLSGLTIQHREKPFIQHGPPTPPPIQVTKQLCVARTDSLGMAALRDPAATLRSQPDPRREKHHFRERCYQRQQHSHLAVYLELSCKTKRSSFRSIQSAERRAQRDEQRPKATKSMSTINRE
ncbi:hypothetical protein EYF80_019182 [Liparis tanakae]|uniref:Uncharacterized protein n=1 Tax=Liparis tanakae TaxID=230148 RepID=A0A4Z2HY61_9TELE|nr:hypothetical protein EYF80_019182 [Liparis tanakae]